MTRFPIFYAERIRSWISLPGGARGIRIECPAEEPQDARTSFKLTIALANGQKLESPQRVRL